MSEEKINLISVKLYTEYYKNNIEDRYIRNYSDNAVIDNDVLKADYGEYVYITTLDKHNKLQQENQELKKQLEELKSTNKVLSEELTKDRILNQDCLTTCCGIPIGDIPKLINQQKEFIKYLEEKEKQFDILGDPKNAGACKGILRKYKEIIGGKDEQ